MGSLMRAAGALLAVLLVASGCSGQERPLERPSESYDYVEYEQGAQANGEDLEEVEEELEVKWFNETLDVRLTHITAAGSSFIPIFVSPNCVTFGHEPRILNGTVEMTWSSSPLSSNLRFELTVNYQPTSVRQGPSPLQVEFDVQEYTPSQNSFYGYQFVALGAGNDAGYDIPIKMALSFRYEGKGTVKPILTDCYLLG